MRSFAVVLLFFCNQPVFAQDAKEKFFTASTPAGAAVREFLGISLKDSIDFIRWQIAITDKRYRVDVQFGISKPNTNGFVNDGKKISLSGELLTTSDLMTFDNSGRRLRFAVLSDDILHITDEHSQMLVGNDGWSYTINSKQPAVNPVMHYRVNTLAFADSMIYVGRTPCAIPGVKNIGAECYKMKWILVLYSGTNDGNKGRYRLRGSIYNHQYVNGSWQKIPTSDGRTKIELLDKDGKSILHLLNADNNILVMSNADGRLLVGDHDFSYTLNRKF